MNKLEQITHQPLKNSILQLYHAAEELKDRADHQELKQLQEAIGKGVDDILAGNLSDADERLSLVAVRLNFLAETGDAEPTPASYPEIIEPPEFGPRSIF